MLYGAFGSQCGYNVFLWNNGARKFIIIIICLPSVVRAVEAPAVGVSKNSFNVSVHVCNKFIIIKVIIITTWLTHQHNIFSYAPDRFEDL
jgi:hypothetical protein